MNTSETNPSSETPKTDAPTKPFRAGWYWVATRSRGEGETDDQLKDKIRKVYPQVERFLIGPECAFGYWEAEVSDALAAAITDKKKGTIPGSMSLEYLPVEEIFADMEEVLKMNAAKVDENPLAALLGRRGRG